MLTFAELLPAPHRRSPGHEVVTLSEKGFRSKCHQRRSSDIAELLGVLEIRLVVRLALVLDHAHEDDAVETHF